MSRRAVEIYTRLRHPELQSAQDTLVEIENLLVSIRRKEQERGYSTTEHI